MERSQSEEPHQHTENPGGDVSGNGNVLSSNKHQIHSLTPVPPALPLPTWFLLFLRSLRNLLVPVQPSSRRASVDRRLIQDHNEEEYQRVQLSVKQSVLDVEGTDMRNRSDSGSSSAGQIRTSNISFKTFLFDP